MNLREAMALVDQGKAITRPFWVGAWVLGPSMAPRVHYTHSPSLPWWPTMEEALATDYKEHHLGTPVHEKGIGAQTSATG